uniref:Uncharacterized protein n=1 Tax=Rhizophora mucronata TaxID=61149 RepID=A0A2P2N424_RHIMU
MRPAINRSIEIKIISTIFVF